MADRRQKLELTWIGKDERPRLEPRILLEDPELSYHAAKRISDHDQFDNMLIHGDNLLALKALEARFAGRIKCIYIDPPYNTGAAFADYDDGLEHSTWLTLMRERLELLARLLAPEGVILVSIDDNEAAYLKVLMDEVFGRSNSCGTFIWEKKKKPSFLHASMGSVTEFILAYARDRSRAPAFTFGATTAGKKYPLNNAGNGVRIIEFPPGSVTFSCDDQSFEPQDMSAGKIKTRLLDRVEVREGRNVGGFRLEGEWRYSPERVLEILAAGEEIRISKSPFRPNHIKAGGEPKKVKNLLSRETYDIPTYEDATAESRALFGDAAFAYPKPEGLIAFLLECTTKKGDLVLDSFAGSGTTGAVAHKMGRRWIMVEIGQQAMTHVQPRLAGVIDGADGGGVTEAQGWRGGGGFRFYRLAPSLLEQDKWGNWIVSKGYNATMLAEAVCKLEGFRYAPDPETFWLHGYSTETDFIYVTTQNLTRGQIEFISDAVGPERTLLICCGSFRVKPDAFGNLTLKKIPQAVLHRCEWGRDDYSLNVQALPPAEAAEEADDEPQAPANSEPKGCKGNRAKKGSRKKATRGMQQLPLFDESRSKKGKR